MYVKYRSQGLTVRNLCVITGSVKMAKGEEQELAGPISLGCLLRYYESMIA